MWLIVLGGRGHGNSVVTGTLTAAQREQLGYAAAYKAASGSFIEFLDWVYILEPPQPLLGREGGKTLFVKWPHLMKFARLLENERLINVLKARQVGISWTISAYVVWLFLFRSGAQIMELSKGELEAQDLLSKAKFIYKSLPPIWLEVIGQDSGGSFTVKGEGGSRIVALPSTEDAGRGPAVTLVVQDEAEFHKYMDKNYLAVKPTIDAGGQMIMVSTVNKRKSVSLFKNVYRGSPRNGWVTFFIPWTSRPGRDKKWYQRTKEEAGDLPEAQEMGIDLYMEQEYPTSADEALAPARAMSVFNQDVLRQMEQDCKKPVTRRGPINIYQNFQHRKRYTAGSDTGHGVGRDYSVTVIIDYDTGYIVADIMSNTIQPDDFTYQSIEMMSKYGNPEWAIEDNEWGKTVLDAAKDARYPHLFKQKTRRGSDVIGFHTDARSRPILWNDLREAIDNRHIVIPNKEGLSQFYSVIYDPNKGDRPQAMEGAHDDYPMALGVAWQARRRVHTPSNDRILMPATW